MEPPFESNESNDVDHLSNLPDCIFHKILGLLDIMTLSRIATLSRRCRYLCLSSPTLNMELEEFSDLDKFGNFMVFFDHFLLLHDEMNIDRFSLCLRGCAMNYYDVGLHVGTWMNNLVGHNFKEINLNLQVKDCFVLPSYILSCPSLRSLKLNLGYGRLRLPTLGFSWLEDLSLKHLQFNDESYGSWLLLSDWISTSCKFLKRLYIGSVDGIKEINIASQSLEELCIHGRFTTFQWEPFCINVLAKELKYLSIKCDVVCFCGCSVKIYAPNLQQFCWTGQVPRMFYLQNSESLQQAYINIIMNQVNDVEIGYMYDFVAQLVKLISQVSLLTLTDLVIERMLTHSLSMLSNLQTLALFFKRRDIAIPLIVSFLKLTPYLRTLKVYFDQSSRWSRWRFISTRAYYDAKYWESRKLQFVEVLREVEIHLTGRHNEIEFVKYLLRNTKALEKMTIGYSTDLLPEPIMTISRELQQFKKASFSLLMNFVPCTESCVCKKIH